MNKAPRPVTLLANIILSLPYLPIWRPRFLSSLFYPRDGLPPALPLLLAATFWSVLSADYPHPYHSSPKALALIYALRIQIYATQYSIAHCVFSNSLFLPTMAHLLWVKVDLLKRCEWHWEEMSELVMTFVHVYYLNFFCRYWWVRQRTSSFPCQSWRFSTHPSPGWHSLLGHHVRHPLWIDLVETYLSGRQGAPKLTRVQENSMRNHRYLWVIFGACNKRPS